jgi:phosphoserine aminotransferase
MKLHTNFTPGPSQLYFTVPDHARQAFKEGIPSISHRSKTFEQISKECTDGLRELLGVPSSHHIFFTGSATEIWERIIENLVAKQCLHLVNGSFSKRFYETAVQLQRKATLIEVAEGNGFSQPLQSAAELIAVTHNETSTGVSLPLSFIEDIRKANPESLLAIDAVSSLPYPAFNYENADTVFFSVQKGFGLPAGLGVWIVNDRCIDKAKTLAAMGVGIGSYHSLPTLLANAKKNQTPETPNVLGIYLLNCVVKDFLRREIRTIRQETDYKASLLYHTLDKHPLLNAFVKDVSFRSKTVIVADCGQHTERLTSFLNSKGLFPGDGYGSNKQTQLRFANFPAHSKEQYELLCDSLNAYHG